MADHRIIAVELDSATLGHVPADVDQERRVAIFDLLETNSFAPARAYPQGYAGPYRIALGVREGRLVVDIATDGGERLETLILSLTRLRRHIKDYFAICDSYFRAVKQGGAGHIETIDMARRGLHNSAAEILVERLDGKVTMDFDTARRLFTLICVLHISTRNSMA